MKHLKTLVLAKSIAAAFIATAGIAAPAISHASPDDGMVCRAGYAGAFDGTKIKCSKTRIVTVSLECTNRLFQRYVARAPGAAGDTSGGRDLCLRGTASAPQGATIGSTDPLTGLTRGQDFVFAEVNPATFSDRVARADGDEAAALTLNVSEVDTSAGTPSVVLNGGFGITDNARVTLTQFTFAIPVLSLISPIVPNLPRPSFP